MSDFCVICGDTEASGENGEYLGFESYKYSFMIERFVCYKCVAAKAMEP